MKKVFSIILVISTLIVGSSVCGFAQNCEIPVNVIVLDEQGLDANSVNILKNRLTDIASKQGLIADMDYTQFFVGAKINIQDKQVVAGPPAQVVTVYGLNIYVADLNNKKVFSSVYLDLKGVGQSEHKSLNSALSRVTPANTKITQAISEGKSKIVDYYNNRYKEILAMADRAAKLNDYAQAIALCSSIPVCTRGGQEATKKAFEYYDKYRDELNEYLYNEAKAAWYASQNEEGAVYAADLLSGIDPQSSSYDKASKLLNEIKSQVRKDIDFEMRKKYEDSVVIEKQKIEAIKEVGVAYGKGQQPNTTILGWMK